MQRENIESFRIRKEATETLLMIQPGIAGRPYPRNPSNA